MITAKRNSPLQQQRPGKPTPGAESNHIDLGAFVEVDAVIEIEETLIGSLIASLRPGDREAVFSMVNDGDFKGDPALGSLYAILKDLHDRSEPTGDFSAIKASCLSAGIWESIGGAARLGKLIKLVSANPRHYARLVRSNSVRIQLIQQFSKCLKSAADPTLDPYATGHEAIEVLESIASSETIEFRSAAQIAADIVSDLDKPPRPMIFSGMPKLDSNVGGFAPGELVVLAARTSIGKSAMAVQIAEHNARRNRPILFFTLEMNSRDIVNRILARLAMVSVRKIQSGELTDRERLKIITAAETLDGCELFPVYMPSAKIGEIRHSAKAFAAQHGIGMVVVDHLQFIGKTDWRQGVRESVSESTRTLKQLAGELNCPVLLLSQFNRETMKQKSPTLSNLSESGSIETDADIVMAIHRRSPQDTRGELLIMKHRNGETMDLTGLIWNGDQMRFYFENENYTEFD